MKLPKDIVREGYNNLSTLYREHYASSHNKNYPAWLSKFIRLIPQGSKVLELGCADGIPVAQCLHKHYQYVGVDISPVQIQNARQNVPEGDFIVADMTDLSFPAHSFSGIVALYVIIHLPLDQQHPLITSMYKWLQIGGYVLVIIGAGAWTGTENNWLKSGVTMYWSHADTDTYINWFLSTGFTIIETQFVPEGKAGHTLLLARKNADQIF